jgi:hypothetical protein
MKRILAIAGAMLITMLFLAPAALAADPLRHAGRVLISTGGDVTIPAGEQADVVVVVNGSATIAGEVNTIVAVDGAANLTGARTETVIAIRSPVNLGEGTVVLGDVMKVDSVVQQFGDAEVLGEVKDMQASLLGPGAVLAPALILLWIGFGVAMIVAGLLLAGVAGRQVRAAEALISDEPVLTLVAGVLGMVVIPLAAFLLIVTVIGAPLGAGILIALWPLVAFVGYLVAGIWIGDWVLHRMQPAVIRERPFLAAASGVLILQALGLVPVLGIVAMFASLFGFGAVVLLAWRTLRSGTAPQTTVVGAAPAPMAS